VLHAADAVALHLRLGATRDLEEGEQRVVAYVEEVVPDPLVGRVAAVARPGAEAGRYLHGMHERHADHARVEVDRHAHVLGIEGEVVDTARGAHAFSFFSTRTVATAFATRLPSAFLASASTKLMLLPSFMTRASAMSLLPEPPPMNEVDRLMVITPSDSGCSVRAAVQRATSRSDIITP